MSDCEETNIDDDFDEVMADDTVSGSTSNNTIPSHIFDIIASTGGVNDSLNPNTHQSAPSNDGDGADDVNDRPVVDTAPPDITDTPSFPFRHMSLKGLLPENIAMSTLQATDKLKEMLSSTVKEKIGLYAEYGRGPDKTLAVYSLNLSFPGSYASKLKNDKALVEAIISPIFKMVDTIHELVLPELGIDTLHYLINERKIFEKVKQCENIEVLFSSETCDEIENHLPNLTAALLTPCKPSIINVSPDQSSAGLGEMKSKFKKKLSDTVEAYSPATTLRYNKTLVHKGTGGKVIGKKRASDGRVNLDNKKHKTTSDAKSAAKKPRKPMKLIPIPPNNLTKFTFDSFESQTQITHPPFTAYTYWQLEKVHTHYTKGEGTVMAIIDDGIDPSHPAFTNKTLCGFKDFCRINVNPASSNHGMLCAGIACGKDFLYPENPLNEMAAHKSFPPGVAPETELIVCKTLGYGENNAMWSTVLEALQWLIEISEKNGIVIDVLSLSIGSLTFIPGIVQAITNLVSKNVIVVCAASNLGHKFSQPICFPARLGHVLCIGSHGPHGKPSSFSPVGQQIDFLAPGEDITGPSNEHYNHYLGTQSGTSFAAPAVAGLICLILSYIKNNANNEDYFKLFKNHWVIKEILREISTSPGRHSDDQGFGALNPIQFFKQPARVLDYILSNNLIFMDSD